MPQQDWPWLPDVEDGLEPLPYKIQAPKVAIATPEGRGRSVTLNAIMAAYNIKNFEIIDFRMPTKDDYWLNNHFMIKPPTVGKVSAKGPRLIIRRTNVGATTAGPIGHAELGDWLRQQQAAGYGQPAEPPER